VAPPGGRFVNTRETIATAGVGKLLSPLGEGSWVAQLAD
jgi:hypothetical protein